MNWKFWESLDSSKLGKTGSTLGRILGALAVIYLVIVLLLGWW